MADFQSNLRVITRGVDQSSQRHLVGTESAWYLLNMRPHRGRLEQTPWLEGLYNLSPINGEGGTFSINLMRRVAFVGTAGQRVSQYFMVSPYTARLINPNTSVNTYIPCVAQTGKPNNTTLTGECLLYGHNTTDFTTDGDKIDVQINTTGALFRWRKNATAWSADIAIGPSVAIGANGLYVSFQGEGSTTDYTNFTIGDTWTWTRTAALPTSITALSVLAMNSPVWASEAYANDVYFCANRVVMRARNNAANTVAPGQNFVTTVGYTRAYGNRCVVFNNHLFVAQYCAGEPVTTEDAFEPAGTPFTLGWSHLNNPDQFFATQLNEADEYYLPNQPHADFQGYGITNMVVWRNLLFVFLADAMSTVQYVGLPNVMLITPTNSQVGCISPDGLIKTPSGIYFIGRTDFYRIRDYEPEAIGAKVREVVFGDLYANNGPLSQLASLITATYNPGAKEVIWTYRYGNSTSSLGLTRQVVYCELTDDWYFRNMPSILTTTAQYTMRAATIKLDTDQVMMYSTDKNVVFVEQTASSVGTPAKDDIGITYTTPQIDTSYMPQSDGFHIKQGSSLHIDAAYSNDGIGIQVGIIPVSLIGAATTAPTVLAQTWTTALPDTRLTLPRKAYRHIAYQFKFIASGASYVRNAVFNFYQEFVQSQENKVEK
jgi:hypothetical protein